ncbi:phosphatidylserine decarboxylase [Endozoicomonas sp. ALC013]|uniref:phosphatidylserine decarboxylase n=1 Tax=Endozoicomonas sp. ALC013 TaxID=3403076 RepID=UPI003BB7DDE6
MECQIPWFKNGLIRWAIDHYHVNMSEAKREGAEEYRHFNDFFTRSLKEGARPLPEDPEMIVSPADGVISQIGDIKNGRIFQAKGHDYSLVELLGGDLELGQEFMGGKFATIYLSPKDYHGEASQSVELSRGDELGRFKLGSTAIVLFGKDQIEWLENWQPGLSIKMGVALARVDAPDIK